MWRAIFEDGTVLDGVTEDGKERSFSNVLNRVQTLKNLSVFQDAKKFTVSMDDGKFTVDIGGVENIFYATDYMTSFSNKLENIRPIYFIRETVQFQVAMRQISGVASPAVRQFTGLGFQANLDGKNIKRYLAILSDGMYTIEDT